MGRPRFKEEPLLEFTRIDHIGQVVSEVAPQVALLEGLFGFRQRRRWENVDRGCRGVSLEVPGRTGVRWEVQAPLSEGSPLQRFLDSPRGPGLHHVAIQVSDVGAAAEELRRLGNEPAVLGEHWIETPIEPQPGGQGLLFRFFGPEVSGVCGDDGGVDDASSESPTAKSEGGPSLGIVAIDHVCHAYRDRDELGRWYERVLGMDEIYRTPDGEHSDLADLVLDIPATTLRWEVIQPVGEDSFMQRFLDTRGAAPHHVTFEVADWERAVAACAHHDIPTFDENQGETDGARWRDAFIHPKRTGGMLVQLFWEEQSGVWVRSDKIPSKR